MAAKRQRSSGSSELSSPSVVVTTAPQSKAALDLESPSLLADLLSPVPSEQFHEHIRGRKALVCKGAPARVKALVDKYLEQGDVARLIAESSSPEGVSVWLNTSAGGQMPTSIKVANPSDAYLLYQAGNSVYMRAPLGICDDFPQALSAQLGNSTSYPDGSCGEVEVFASHHGAFTRLHTDFQENFTLQLLGTKTWRVHVGQSPWPLRAIAPHFGNTPRDVLQHQIMAAKMCQGHEAEVEPPAMESELWEEVVVHAGDMFYHPPGLWHAVTTTSEESLSINVSLVAPSLADLVAWSVKHYLARFESFRAPFRADIDCSKLLRDAGIVLPFAVEASLPPVHPVEDEEMTVSLLLTRNPLAVGLVVDGDEEDDEEAANGEEREHDESGGAAASVVRLRVCLNAGSDDLTPLVTTNLKVPSDLARLVDAVLALNGGESLKGAKLAKLAAPHDWRPFASEVVNAGLLLVKDSTG